VTRDVNEIRSMREPNQKEEALMEIKRDWLLLGKHESSGRIETEFRYQEDGDLKKLVERKQVDVLLSTAEGGIGEP
jgi:hypothetical protein